METDPLVARARGQAEAIEDLVAYRKAAERLPDAVRRAVELGVSVSAIAEAAGVSRGRIDRILGK